MNNKPYQATLSQCPMEKTGKTSMANFPWRLGQTSHGEDWANFLNLDSLTLILGVTVEKKH